MSSYNIGLDPNLVTPPSKHFTASTVLTRSITCKASRQTRYLLKQGCDPNMTIGKRKMRQLMVTCFVKNKQKRVAIVKTLLQHGADPSLTDVRGRSSVMYACALSLKDEVELMVKDCDYNLNATDMYGDTALHMCAKAGDTDTLGVLLREMQRYRMDISVQNNSYLTPLSLAILNGHCNCATMLHASGAFPRFSPPALSQVLSVLCKQHEVLGNSGVKAIADARSVGRAFNAKNYFMYNVDAILKSKIPSPYCSKVENADLAKVGLLSKKETLYMCSCLPTSDKTFKLPPIHDVCRQPKMLSFY